MALSGTALGDAMKSAIDAAVVSYPSATEAQRTAIFRALGTAIVDYFKANAVVAVTVPSVSAVTPGVGISGPGVGTGSVGAGTGGIT